MKKVFVIVCVAVATVCFPIVAQETRPVTTMSMQSDLPTSEIEITTYDNRIQVKNAPVGSMLEIYSIVGIKVKEIEMKQSSGEYAVSIARGYYIIRIDETIRKVAIR